jgi:hypothetical protein
MSLWLLAYNITRLSLPGRVEVYSLFTKIKPFLRSTAGPRATFRTKVDVCERSVWALHHLSPFQMELITRRLSQCMQSDEVRRNVRAAKTGPLLCPLLCLSPFL